MKTLFKIIFPLLLLIASQVQAQYVTNYAGKFNGTTTRAALYNNAELDLRNGYTIEAWIYYEHVQGQNKIICVDTSSGTGLSISGSGSLSFTYNKTATALLDMFPVQKWTHIAVTNDRVTANVYINGVQTFSVAGNGPIGPPSGYTYIGGVDFGGAPVALFKGMIDDFRIWSRAKTMYEVNRDMYLSLASLKPTGSYRGLAASVRFDRPNFLVDEAGAEVTGLGFAGLAWENYSNTSTLRSTYNSSLVLDGTSSFCVAPPHQKQNASSAFTLEAWAKIDKSGPRDAVQEIVSKTGTGSSYSYRMYMRNDSIATFVVNAAGEYKIEAVVSSPYTWNHIAGTYNAVTGKMNLYVNGALLKTENKTPASIQVTAGDSLYIGKCGMSSIQNSRFKGQIDEIKIWSEKERTAAQINQYLHQGINTDSDPGESACVYGFDGRNDDAAGTAHVNPLTALAFYGNAYMRSPKFYAPLYSTAPLLWQAPGNFIDNTWNLSLKSRNISANSTAKDSIYFASNGTIQAPKVMVLFNSENIHKTKLSLIAPDGTTVQLTPEISNAAEKSDLMAVFSDDASQVIAYSDSSLAPFSAVVKPYGQLSALNGKQRRGWWKLKIESAITGEASLVKWGIQSSVLTSTGENGVTLKTYSLEQNYPNPFNPSTTIKFNLPSNIEGIVKLAVYDVTGREVAQLVNSSLKGGNYEYTWDAASFSSGMYFYTLQTSAGIITKKMLLVK